MEKRRGGGEVRRREKEERCRGDVEEERWRGGEE